MLKVLDLFSGIGGFSLGLERTGGFETVAFCEIDPFCRKVLAKHWPGVPIYEDVKGLRHDGPIDVVCGGFPCQPFSHAGKRGGVDDDRYLWPAMLEVIEAHRPAWVIGENVAGLTSMGVADSPFEVESRTCIRTDDEDNYHSVRSRQEILLLRTIIADLEQAAYAVQPFVIPACGLDAPHQRPRIWIIAHTNDILHPRELAAGENPGETSGSERGDTSEGRAPNRKRLRAKFGAGSSVVGNSQCDGRRQSPEHPETTQRALCEAELQESAPGTGPSGEALADCIGARLQNSEGGGSIDECVGVRTPDSGCSGSGGRNGWLPEPNVGRVANGVPQRVDRLRSLGNAVVPQITEILGHAILEAEGLT